LGGRKQVRKLKKKKNTTDPRREKQRGHHLGPYNKKLRKKRSGREKGKREDLSSTEQSQLWCDPKREEGKKRKKKPNGAGTSGRRFLLVRRRKKKQKTEEKGGCQSLNTIQFKRRKKGGGKKKERRDATRGRRDSRGKERWQGSVNGQRSEVRQIMWRHLETVTQEREQFSERGTRPSVHTCDRDFVFLKSPPSATPSSTRHDGKGPRKGMSEDQAGEFPYRAKKSRRGRREQKWGTSHRPTDSSDPNKLILRTEWKKGRLRNRCG